MDNCQMYKDFFKVMQKKFKKYPNILLKNFIMKYEKILKENPNNILFQNCIDEYNKNVEEHAKNFKNIEENLKNELNNKLSKLVVEACLAGDNIEDLINYINTTNSEYMNYFNFEHQVAN